MTPPDQQNKPWSRAGAIIVGVGLVLLAAGYLLSHAAVALIPGLVVIVIGCLWSRVQRAGTSHQIADTERLRAERDRLMAEVKASGKPLTMTDAQYEHMRQLADAAGPEAQERFRETARMAGRLG